MKILNINIQASRFLSLITIKLMDASLHKNMLANTTDNIFNRNGET